MAGSSGRPLQTILGDAVDRTHADDPGRVLLIPEQPLRLEEMCAADVADLGSDRGHRVLGIPGKGSRSMISN
jgi:hypothetical protein